MFITLIALLLITLSGTILTYLYEREDSLLARVCAGNIIGSALFGLIAFILACVFGFSPATILISLGLILSVLLLLIRKPSREKFTEDIKNAGKKLENTNLQKILSVAYYLAFLIVFYFFFDRAMLETAQGIATGATQNYGDLPFHLGAIFSFTEGGNFPPENPSFAYAKFTYPFMADFLTACFVKLGAGVANAMLVQNIFLGFSFVVLLEKFAFALTKNRLAAKLTPIIFLLSGGLGFLLFFRDYWQSGRDFFAFVWNIPKDYTIRPENLRWGNPLVVLFITQRSFLLGMPVTLIALTKLWKVFTKPKAKEGSLRSANYKIFFVGLLAGTLPLIHVHSLIVLFIVTGFLFFFRLDKWREWVAFGIGVSICAVPELLWALTGSATNLGKFIEWHFGWDKGQNNFFWFWVLNLGIFIPLLFSAICFVWMQEKNISVGPEDNDELKLEEDNRKDDKRNSQFTTHNSPLISFYLPFGFLFILCNTMKLAPWEWDNIKVLIYWFIASVPLVAWFLTALWEKRAIYKFIFAGCLVFLTASGAIDIWRIASKQISYGLFSADAVKIAEQLKLKIPPKAMILNAPTFNTAIVLSGRRSLMRYSGHLNSYGIDYEPRQREVERIYEGSALAYSLLKENKIEYVIVSPEEKSTLKNVDEDFFRQFPVVAEAGDYRVYQVK